MSDKLKHDIERLTQINADLLGENLRNRETIARKDATIVRLNKNVSDKRKIIHNLKEQVRIQNDEIIQYIADLSRWRLK